MSKSNYWKYYIGIDVPCGGLSVSPKPVRLIEWELFQTLAYEPLRINEELMRKQLKIDEKIKLFDYLIDYMMEKAKRETGREEYGLIILAQIFSLAYRLPVELRVVNTDTRPTFAFCINGNEDDLITRNNYEAIREMIMEQNLIFEPIIAADERSQKVIDKAIERKRNITSNTETNMEQSRAIPVYRAVGADIEPIIYAEVLSMHEDPYSFDKMFKKNDRKKDDLSK